MAIALSWQIGGVAVGLIAAGLAWNGLSRYLAARQAKEIIQESAHAAAMQAEQAQEQARQRKPRAERPSGAAEPPPRQRTLAPAYWARTDSRRTRRRRRTRARGPERFVERTLDIFPC